MQHTSSTTYSYNNSGTLQNIRIENPNHPTAGRVYLDVIPTSQMWGEPKAVSDFFIEAENAITEGSITSDELALQAEFDDWGVYFRVDDDRLSSNGSDVYFSQDKNGQGVISTTERYWFEKKVNGNWEIVPTMTGSIVILLVMLARLILKRSPKIFSYVLWSVVLFRLLCPVAFTAPVSVLDAFQPEVMEASDSTSIVYYLPVELQQESNFIFVPAENQSRNQMEQPDPAGHFELDIMQVASCVWVAGTVAMLLYSVIQYIRLILKLFGAVAYRGNVYRADYIDTPFVMGIFSPKIYLPSDVPTKERKYIIAHERHHIRRFDHIIKLLAYFALCIHWFNSLVWAAFILAGKDMEMSCDEAVIKCMGFQIRADYSASLLRLATRKMIIAGMPLAFGEGDTKGRVMNMAKWKKPKLWVVLFA